MSPTKIGAKSRARETLVSEATPPQKSTLNTSSHQSYFSFPNYLKNLWASMLLFWLLEQTTAIFSDDITLSFQLALLDMSRDRQRQRRHTTSTYAKKIARSLHEVFLRQRHWKVNHACAYRACMDLFDDLPPPAGRLQLVLVVAVLVTLSCTV